MKKIKAYIAGGWFTEESLAAIEIIKDILRLDKRFNYFSPKDDNKLEDQNKYSQQICFERNLQAIDNCDIVIASTINKDMGTLFECGYAYAKGKKIIYTYLGSDNIKFNLMLAQSSIACCTSKYQLRDALRLLQKIDHDGEVE